GVATANSILLVSFARQRREEGASPALAARDAGATRIRPVLMTALAMIIGMIPMALGIGERAARPRRHRRIAVRDGVDAALRPGRLRRRPRAARAPTRRARPRGGRRDA